LLHTLYPSVSRTRRKKSCMLRVDALDMTAVSPSALSGAVKPMADVSGCVGCHAPASFGMSSRSQIFPLVCTLNGGGAGDLMGMMNGGGGGAGGSLHQCPAQSALPPGILGHSSRVGAQYLHGLPLRMRSKQYSQSIAGAPGRPFRPRGRFANVKTCRNSLEHGNLHSQIHQPLA
jgi:hypothetical protein